MKCILALALVATTLAEVYFREEFLGKDTSHTQRNLLSCLLKI